jgi:hypothetical protein
MRPVREIKDEIIAAFVAEKKRQPSSHEMWVRYFAHPEVIARQAAITLTSMSLKAQWLQWQRQSAQEKK